MRVVNLAKRPFRNRRPVARLALALWILGGLLLALNLWWWGGYFRGSSTSSDRLELLDRQVRQEEQKLEDYWQDLRQVQLGARNQKAKYLNLLIHRRTFPWSRLFDQLESVLPDNVYLEEVSPDIQFADDPKTRSRTRRSSGRRVSLREARARARAAAQGEEIEVESSRPAEPEEPDVAEEQRDRVLLSLSGYARTEEAFFEFLDLLYAHPSFLDPDLSQEKVEESDVVGFRIKVVYLTPLREVLPVLIEDLPPEEGDDGPSSSVADSGGDPAPEEGTSGTLAAGPTGSAVPTIDPETASAIAGAESEAGAADPAAGRPGPGFVEETLRERRTRADARRAARERAASSSPSGADADRSRQTRTGGSSRVSVAPRQRATGTSGGARTAEPAPSGAGEVESSQPVRRADPRRTAPAPRSSGAAEDRSTSQPQPTQPSASASPRLRGMLRFLPDFLRPELAVPAASPEEEAA
ncbi:MAG: hypothetical protein AAFX50_02515 [Acidobacteriota bacterium]